MLGSLMRPRRMGRTPFFKNSAGRAGEGVLILNENVKRREGATGTQVAKLPDKIKVCYRGLNGGKALVFPTIWQQ